MTPAGYDIIGDVRGQARKLVALLETLGYRLSAACGVILRASPSSSAI